jgi:PTH1 family peptidyl-tRNA hydrolase
VKRVKFKALVGEARLGVPAEKVILVKPQTYMNLSGESLREVVDFYKIEPDHLIVIYDDLDLDVGRIRIRPHGSAGTHKGMQSVIYQLGYDDFPRIRIGIGDRGNMDIKDYVTGGFTKDEVAPLEDAVDRAVEAVLCIIRDDVTTAMNKYNGSGK